MPAQWWEIIDRNVPYVRRLPESDRRELGGHVQVLLHEKHFEGCGGLELTDEIRVTIAAQAAVLLLHRETDYYPTLTSILVYPHAYISDRPRRQPDGTVIEGRQVRLGESWFRGSLVFSWDDVLRGTRNPHDGQNVVLHEFAHQLDGESGAMEGAPALGTSDRYQAWARVLGEEYRELIQSVKEGWSCVLDAYGASSPPEFFAIATEAFFERPLDLKRCHPELYAELARFYRQYPASAHPEAGG